MNDQKVVNIENDIAAQNLCPFCKAGPKDVMDTTKDFGVDPSYLCELCMSILHFTIRTFEHFCKIGFKQDVKKFTKLTNEEKEKVKERTKWVKAEFLKKGLPIFEPRPGGSSNDGNLARDAFKDPEWFASVVGVPAELMRKINFIRIALASTLKKNPAKFGQICKEAKDIYIANCKWYPFNPTLHKILGKFPLHFFKDF